jgi:hypothetical protein
MSNGTPESFDRQESIDEVHEDARRVVIAAADLIRAQTKENDHLNSQQLSYFTQCK